MLACAIAPVGFVSCHRFASRGVASHRVPGERRDRHVSGPHADLGHSSLRAAAKPKASLHRGAAEKVHGTAFQLSGSGEIESHS